jgi:hypothetical protein
MALGLATTRRRTLAVHAAMIKHRLGNRASERPVSADRSAMDDSLAKRKLP